MPQTSFDASKMSPNGGLAWRLGQGDAEAAREALAQGRSVFERISFDPRRDLSRADAERARLQGWARTFDSLWGWAGRAERVDASMVLCQALLERIDAGETSSLDIRNAWEKGLWGVEPHSNAVAVQGALAAWCRSHEQPDDAWRQRTTWAEQLYPGEMPVPKRLIDQAFWSISSNGMPSRAKWWDAWHRWGLPAAWWSLPIQRPPRIDRMPSPWSGMLHPNQALPPLWWAVIQNDWEMATRLVERGLGVDGTEVVSFVDQTDISAPTWNWSTLDLVTSTLALQLNCRPSERHPSFAKLGTTIDDARAEVLEVGLTLVAAEADLNAPCPWLIRRDQASDGAPLYQMARSTEPGQETLADVWHQEFNHAINRSDMGQSTKGPLGGCRRMGSSQARLDDALAAWQVWWDRHELRTLASKKDSDVIVSAPARARL